MPLYILQILFLLLLAASSTYAQGKVPSVAFDTLRVEEYVFTSLGNGQDFLKMPYAGTNILNPSTATSLMKGRVVEKVQLVYTQYPAKSDLTDLNKRRLAALHTLWPELFAGGVRWELVIQTKCSSEEEASTLFHGFVITHKDLESYTGALSGVLKMELLMEGRLRPQDSTILRIMERNRHWEDILVIADLTGSMSPYIGQFLLWLRLNRQSKPAKYFVFFNDGDEKPDLEKEIGKTGGIYSTDALTLDSVLMVAKHTMSMGYGGDEPENNLEATLFGIKRYPKFKEIVMIADNWATPRDMELATKVKAPIRILLCGTENGINPKYLDLARITKGSVHTIEEDIDKLMQLNEGETITIGKVKYRISKGEFQRAE